MNPDESMRLRLLITEDFSPRQDTLKYSPVRKGL
jgi:hypothetical protein